MELEPGRRVGDYVVEARLGGGGMASVYRVRHTLLESVHAMKVLASELVVEPEIRQRFLEEGKIQAKLRHPNIVAVTGLVAEPGIAALVMEHIDGPSLETWLEQQTAPVDPGFLAVVFRQVLAGLGHAHKHGIVHRDVKPANILLQWVDGRPDRVFVADFGIAKTLEGPRATRTSARMGTVGYMSPEQVRSAKDVDARSDVFSVGVAMYECATGRLPFEGAGDFEVQTAIVQGRYAPVLVRRPDLDPALADAITRAMANDRRDRFQTCEDFARALRAPGPRKRPAEEREEAEPPVVSLDEPRAPTEGETEEDIPAEAALLPRKKPFGGDRFLLILCVVLVAGGAVLLGSVAGMGGTSAPVASAGAPAGSTPGRRSGPADEASPRASSEVDAATVASQKSDRAEQKPPSAPRTPATLGAAGGARASTARTGGQAEKAARVPRESASETPAERQREPVALAGASTASAAPPPRTPVLDPRQVAAVLERARPSFEQCLATALRRDPYLRRGKVLIYATVGPYGIVSKAAVDDAWVEESELGGCLRTRAKSLVFPAFLGDPTVIQIPLVVGGG